MPNRSGFNVLSGSEQSVDRVPIGGAMRSDEGDHAILRGQTALAGGIADVGGTISNAVIFTQRAKNEADLVRGRLAMKRIAGANQVELEKNANPDEWGAITKRVLDEGSPSVFGETPDRKRKISDPVKKQLEEEWAAFASDQTQGVEFQALRQHRKESDLAFEEDAAKAYNAGDIEGGDAAMDKRAKHGTQSEKMVNEVLKPKGREAGARVQASQRLAAIEKLNPREQEQAYAKLPEQLKEGVKHLSERDRLTVESQALHAQREATHALDTNALQTVRGLRNGSLTLDDIGKAYDAGQLRDLAMTPEYEKAAGVFQAEAADKAQTEREQKQAKARAAAGRFEDVQKAALSTMTMGEREIDLAVQQGSLTPGQAAETKARLRVLSIAQQTEAAVSDVQKPEEANFGSIRERLDSLYAIKVLGPPEERGPRPSQEASRATYDDILNQIRRAPLTMPNRLALMEKMYVAKIADITNLKEDDGTWFGRKISVQEAGLRLGLIRDYKQIDLASLGLQQAGALLFGQEDIIVDFFRENPEPSAADRKVLYDRLKKMATEAVSTDLFGGLVDG